MEAVKQEFETMVIAVDRIRPNTWNLRIRLEAPCDS